MITATTILAASGIILSAFIAGRISVPREHTDEEVNTYLKLQRDIANNTIRGVLLLVKTRVADLDPHLAAQGKVVSNEIKLELDILSRGEVPEYEVPKYKAFT